MTLSPWLIQTSRSPWPSALTRSWMPSSSARVPARAHLGIAELAHRARLDGAAELRRHRLHPVADAEHGHAQRPDDRPARAACGPRSRSRGPPERTMPFGREARESRRRRGRTDGSRSRRASRAAGARSAACTARRSRGSGCGSGWRRSSMRCKRKGRRRCRPGHVLRSLDPVVRRFLHDLHVVHVRLADACRGDLDELAPCATARRWSRSRNSPSPRAGRPSAGGSTLTSGALERHAALDALGHELLGVASRPRAPGSSGPSCPAASRRASPCRGSSCTSGPGRARSRRGTRRCRRTGCPASRATRPPRSPSRRRPSSGCRRRRSAERRRPTRPRARPGSPRSAARRRPRRCASCRSSPGRCRP